MIKNYQESNDVSRQVLAYKVQLKETKITKLKRTKPKELNLSCFTNLT